MNPKNIFFTADTHFGHKNILKYCDRPCKSILEMDQKLIDNWNEIVKPNDHIFHLGDFAFCGKKRVLEILEQLNGKKYLIKGNHDAVMKGEVLDHFEWAKDYHELKVQDPEINVVQMLTLFHYPLESWNKAYRGSFALHGHCHGTVLSSDSQARIDVGVDCHNYRPISYNGVKLQMAQKSLNLIANDV